MRVQSEEGKKWRVDNNCQARLCRPIWRNTAAVFARLAMIFFGLIFASPSVL